MPGDNEHELVVLAVDAAKQHRVLEGGMLTQFLGGERNGGVGRRAEPQWLGAENPAALRIRIKKLGELRLAQPATFGRLVTSDSRDFRHAPGTEQASLQEDSTPINRVHSLGTQRRFGGGTHRERELVVEHVSELDAQAISSGWTQPAVPAAVRVALQVELVRQLPVGHGAAFVSNHQVQRSHGALAFEYLNVSSHYFPSESLDHSPGNQGLEGQAELVARQALLQCRPGRASSAQEGIESWIVSLHERRDTARKTGDQTGSCHHPSKCA